MEAKPHLNFELSVSFDESGDLTVAVVDSPVGEALEIAKWPFSDEEIELFLLRVGHARRGVPGIKSPETEAARDFGSALYDVVFAGDVGTAFARSLDEAERRGQGLQLRLRIDDPRLSEVPWEFLYGTSLHRFVAISSTTPIVRYIEAPQPISPLHIDGPVRILTMVTSPTNVFEIDVEDEWTRLSNSLEGLTHKGLVELHRLEEGSLSALRRELRRSEYHVFHFIGYGDFDETSNDGVLLFEDEVGQADRVSGEILARVLLDNESLRLVILQSSEGARTARDPFGDTAQGLVQQGIPAVIGMQFEISDNAAITFSQNLYAAIADAYPVDAALAEARKAIFTSGYGVEWGTPVLHTRTPDGRIFEKRDQFAAPQAADTDLSDRMAAADRELLDLNIPGMVAKLESLVRDYPESAVAANRLAAVQAAIPPDEVEDEVVAFKVFLSYRREDTEGDAGRLYDSLAAVFGPDAIFKDVDDVPLGQNWKESVRDAVEQSSAVLVVVGPAWELSGALRLELETAFATSVTIIPILVRGAIMPVGDALPAALKEFADLNAALLDHATWHRDLRPVIRTLEEFTS